MRITPSQKPALVRLPLVRSVVSAEKVALQIVGSVLAPVGAADGAYIGPDGFTFDIAQAQDFAPTISEENIIVESPGVPGKSAYEIWLLKGNEGTVDDYLLWLKGAPGLNATDQQVGVKVAEYLLANPPPAGADATDAQVSSAVSAYLTSHPPAAGQNATDAQVASAVSEYLVAHPPASGQNATDQQVATAAAAYLAANVATFRGQPGASGATLLGTITVTETAAVAIQAGTRRLSIATPSGWGVTAGQNLLLFPTTVQTGFAFHDIVATGTNTVSVGVTAPLLSIGTSYSISCRVVRINT